MVLLYFISFAVSFFSRILRKRLPNILYLIIAVHFSPAIYPSEIFFMLMEGVLDETFGGIVKTGSNSGLSMFEIILTPHRKSARILTVGEKIGTFLFLTNDGGFNKDVYFIKCYFFSHKMLGLMIVRSICFVVRETLWKLLPSYPCALHKKKKKRLLLNEKANFDVFHLTCYSYCCTKSFLLTEC